MVSEGRYYGINETGEKEEKVALVKISQDSLKAIFIKSKFHIGKLELIFNENNYITSINSSYEFNEMKKENLKSDWKKYFYLGMVKGGNFV